MNTWGLVGLVLIFFLGVLLLAVSIGGIYELGTSPQGIAYRLNRFTGALWYCVPGTPGQCIPQKEE
jgi:hypothetical protein